MAEPHASSSSQHAPTPAGDAIDHFLDNLLALAQRAEAQGHWPDEARPVTDEVLAGFAGVLALVAWADHSTAMRTGELAMLEALITRTMNAPAKPEAVRALIVDGLLSIGALSEAGPADADPHDAAWKRLQAGEVSVRPRTVPAFLCACLAHDCVSGDQLAARAVDWLEMAGFEMIVADGMCGVGETEALGHYIGFLRAHLHEAGVLPASH